MQGAVHGLMADLLDSHVRETLAENRHRRSGPWMKHWRCCGSYLK